MPSSLRQGYFFGGVFSGRFEVGFQGGLWQAFRVV
jgi:hypothetical protein